MSARDDGVPAFPQHGWTSDPADAMLAERAK